MSNRTKNNPQPAEIPTAPRGMLLGLFLDRQGIKRVDLAKRFDVTPAMISTVLNSEEAPTKYVDALRDEYGVPEELLPVGVDKKPGPKPKQADEAA